MIQSGRSARSAKCLELGTARRICLDRLPLDLHFPMDEAEGRQERNGLVAGIGLPKLAHHTSGDLRDLQRVGHSRAIKIAVA